MTHDVGRTPWSADGPLAGLLFVRRYQQPGEDAWRGTGVPPFICPTA
jgi:hypothetical protein